MRIQTRLTSSLLLPLVVAVGLGVAARDANADDPNQVARAQRCATRLSISLLGEAASEALRSDPDPQSHVAELLAMPSFRERFARFVNAAHNRDPGEFAAEDASYWLTVHVLENNLPWKELFVGRFGVVEDENEDENKARVVADPNGLGYFRSYPWLARYAGNEESGLKIRTAYRIMHNTIGLRLTAVTNAPNVDISAKGRAKQPCASCHQDNWSALDKVATVLTRRNDEQDDVTFDPPRGGAQQVLDGVTVSNDGELVAALVDSDQFRFWQCRMAFNYLYGRDENRCEGPIFDLCVTAFTETGKIESALEAIAAHPSFCQ